MDNEHIRVLAFYFTPLHFIGAAVKRSALHVIIRQDNKTIQQGSNKTCSNPAVTWLLLKYKMKNNHISSRPWSIFTKMQLRQILYVGTYFNQHQTDFFSLMKALVSGIDV